MTNVQPKLIVHFLHSQVWFFLNLLTQRKWCWQEKHNVCCCHNITSFHFIYSAFSKSVISFHLWIWTYKGKELLNFQMYCPMECDTIYPGGTTPTFQNDLWFQTNLLPPISLFISLCFEGNSIISLVSETIAALIKSSSTHLHHFSV
jgi:hypothetical protein